VDVFQLGDIMVKIKSNQMFESKVFKTEVKFYFSNTFIKLFKKYRLNPAKGGKLFEDKIRKGEINGVDLPDMSYPMHILNGIVPSLKVLENKWLDRGLINKNDENNDIKMLIRCLCIAYTFHDINKLHNEIDLKKSVEEYLEDDLNDLKLGLNEEEKDIIKYLVLATEERTRYTISDEKLPSRLGIDRLIKDDLIEIIHLADGISIPINEYGGLLKIWKKLKEHVDANIIYFDETPYELLTRFVVERLREEVNCCYIISPRGFIYEGDSNLDDIGNNITYLKRTFEDFLLRNVEKLITVDRQKAQLDVFRFIDINIENMRKFMDKILKKYEFDYFYRGITKNEEINELFVKEFEGFNNDEKRQFILLKFLLQLTPTESNKKDVKLLKDKLSKKYFEVNNYFNMDGKIVDDIKNSKDTGLKNYLKLYLATKVGFSEEDILNDLKYLLNENYKGSEKVDLNIVINEIMNYIYLYGVKLKNIDVKDIGSKKKICSLCGCESEIVANQNLCFGFKPRGFTNRTVVSLNNTAKNICPLCLTEVIFRKIVFGNKENVQSVYIDAYDYFVPILDEELTKYVEEMSENLGNFLKNDIEDYKNSIVYGFRVKSGEELTPFLMSFVDISNQVDFIRFYRNILNFVYNTGFKVYLTYPFNPDKIKKETILFDYSPKSFKKLKWERVRIDEIENIKKEFDILWKLGYTIKGGSKSANIVVSLFNDYADNPMAFFYYLSKLDNPSSFVNKDEVELNPIVKRISGEKMNILEKLADVASDIEWSSKSASSKTSMIRESLEVLKTGVKKRYDEENIKALMAGMLYRKYPYQSKKEPIEEFCNILYDELFKGVWKGKIPSKKEQRYWTYGFGLYYSIKSDEKRKKYFSKKEN